MRFRGTSIRHRIRALVLVPLVSLVSVWALATAITAGEARELRAAASAADSFGPAVEDLLRAVQEERRQTLVYRADPRRADALDRLQETRGISDGAVTELLALAGRGQDGLGPGAAEALDDLTSARASLAQVRQRVGNNTVSRTGALDAYNAVTAPALRLLAALQPVDDTGLDRHGRAVAGVAQAREYLSQEDAMVAGALAAGRITQAEVDALAERVTQRETTYATLLPDLPLADREAHESFWEDGTGQMLRAAERGLARGGTRAVQADEWDAIAATALRELGRLGTEAGAHHEAAADSEAAAVTLRAAVVGVGGLAAALFSAVVGFRIGRNHLREVRTLSREAREAADVRLPGVMRRLAAGERVDVETEAPRLDYPPDDIGQAGRAVNTLQRAALSAVVERTAVRRGVSEVFVNLARRAQVLLHRQLNLLETVEDRFEHAGDRADLVRLAHLTTRMRRHAEGLVVLSGVAPARQWSKPELLMDVVRGAVDEVEEYERVEIRRLPPLTVAGAAVTELTHLLAELLENATVFSPPHTAVQVYGERVPHGFTLEIHDRGLGMTAEALREANERLSSPPDLDLSDTGCLGLQVVARLAERHGVRVCLKESPYGGTTAVTLIPGALLTEVPEEEPGAAGPGGHPPLLAGPADGPVELEAPVSSPPGAAAPTFPATAGSAPPGAPAGGPPADGEEHHAAAPEPPVPLPRRRPPVLVADHGHPVTQPPAAPGAAGTTGAGLPRRVRKAAGTPGQGPDPRGAGPGAALPGDGREPEPDAASAGGHHGGVAELDAEAVRTRMAALQRGWRRGRQQTDTRQGGHPAPGTQP